jgi:ParB family chromosome partitioning protein
LTAQKVNKTETYNQSSPEVINAGATTAAPANNFTLLQGARRYRAAILAELFSIPARIVEIDDTQALEWQLVELSIVGNSFLRLHAARHVIYM